MLPVARALDQAASWRCVLFNVVFIVYHVPALLQRRRRRITACTSPRTWLFIVLAVITWWPILSPLPELPPLSYPLRMIYVFGQTFSGFIVGAFITNAPTVLYPFYAARPASGACRPLDDQKIGGLIMWVIGGVTC